MSDEEPLKISETLAFRLDECSEEFERGWVGKPTDDKGIRLADNTSISMEYDITPRTTHNNLTRFQFIVARTALLLSQRDIASHLGLTQGSCNKFEDHKNNYYLKSTKKPMEDIVTFFLQEGLNFPNNNSVLLKKNNK